MIKCQAKIFDENGNVMKEHSYKFHLDQEVWYVQRNWNQIGRKRFKVYKARICAFVFTNCPSYQLFNGNTALEESLFETEEAAVERAMWLNEKDRIMGN